MVCIRNDICDMENPRGTVRGKGQTAVTSTSSSMPMPVPGVPWTSCVGCGGSMGIASFTVASFHHDIGGSDSDDDGEEHVTVGDGPDEADLAVVNRTRPGDYRGDAGLGSGGAGPRQRGPLLVAHGPRVHARAHRLSAGRAACQGEASACRRTHPWTAGQDGER